MSLANKLQKPPKLVEIADFEDSEEELEDEIAQNYRKHLERDVIKTFDLLEFEKKAKSFLRVSKLNDPLKNKEQLLKDLLVFCMEYFAKVKEKVWSVAHAKANCALLKGIYSLLAASLRYAVTHGWFVSSLDSETVTRVEMYLSDEYFESSKVISVVELIADEDMSKPSVNPTANILIQIFDTISMCCNLQAKVLSESQHPNQAFNSLYQAILIKRLKNKSHFDLFQNIYYCANFTTLLIKTNNQAIGLKLLVKLMSLTEKLIGEFRVNMMLTSKVAESFLSKFVFLEDQLISAELQAVPEKLNELMGDEAVTCIFASHLKVLLTQLYRVAGEVLHEQGRYSDAYLMDNYHKNLHAELVGDEYKQKFAALLQQAEDKKLELRKAKTGQLAKEREEIEGVKDQSQSDYFNKPWRLLPSDKKNKDGFLICEFKK